MATVTVGATGRDYSTVAAAEADLDNAGVHSAGNPAIFELYADADFTEASFTVDGGGTLGVSEIRIRPASGQGHTGTPNTGVRFLGATNHLFTSSVMMYVHDLEFDANGGSTRELLEVNFGADLEIARCLGHNIVRSQTARISLIMAAGASTNLYVYDCIVFDIENQNTGGAAGVRIDGSAIATSEWYNNTVADIRCTSASGGDANGFFYPDDSDLALRNNLTADMSSTAGTAAGYANSSPANVTTQTNGSDDTSSPDGASFQSLGVTFEDAASGDYRLASGDTDAMDVGTDLGTVTAAVDILGRDRDAQGDTWDLGAHEFVGGGGVVAGRGRLIGGKLVGGNLVAVH